ncbi:RNA-binding protein [Candidatus Micrarchaeota archaeon CG08_land_8_20_14_0_20_59_11]|nr:MAG: RNA-binding protein [Candidatus Micrarchaeota archaeon CG08_land_8_20_14_0_20_59_11]
MILDEVKEAYVRDLLAKGSRADGRQLLQYRKVKVTKGAYPNAEGSALAEIGDTKVAAGVKFDAAIPFPDRPQEGVFMVNSEFPILAHPAFEPGPPNENSIELARVVDRGIRSAEVIDLKSLVLEEGKVLGIFVDLYVLDHSGNLIDCAALAAMAALADAKVPKYDAETKKLLRDQPVGALPIAHKIVTCSFEKIGSKILADGTDEEEIASDGRYTIATADSKTICATQKSGAAGFTRQEIVKMMDIALEKGEELRKLI